MRISYRAKPRVQTHEVDNYGHARGPTRERGYMGYKHDIQREYYLVFTTTTKARDTST